MDQPHSSRGSGYTLPLSLTLKGKVLQILKGLGCGCKGRRRISAALRNAEGPLRPAGLDLEKSDRSSWAAVTVLDLRRGKQEVGLLWDLLEVGQVFNPDHAIGSEGPVRP